MTVSDIIKGALELCGVISAEETPSAADSGVGYRVLSSMLDAWSAENLMILGVQREVIELTPGKSKYTFGLSGFADFSTLRPMVLKGVSTGVLRKEPIYGEPIIPEDDPETPEDESLEPPVIPIEGYDLYVDTEIPVEIIDEQTWIALSTKAMTSGLVSYLYRQGTGIDETYHVWPVPSEAQGLVLYSQKASILAGSLSTELNLPPGYNAALEYCLAVELAPRFGKTIPAFVEAKALDLKANLKIKNSRTPRMVSDVLTKKPFNLISGE